MSKVNRSIDWNSVDWSKSIAQLATQYGVSTRTISKYKRIAGAKRKSTGTERNKINWSVVDWSLSDAQIAKIHGISKYAVAGNRYKFAPTRFTDWDFVDWSKSDADLATELSKKIATVKHQRNVRVETNGKLSHSGSIKIAKASINHLVAKYLYTELGGLSIENKKQVQDEVDRILQRAEVYNTAPLEDMVSCVISTQDIFK